MRSTTSSKPKSRAGARRTERTPARANRAQLRAMEARAVVTVPEASASSVEPETAVVASGGAAALTRRRPVVRARVLTRSEEYAYIKDDMRRLIITGSILFVVMIGLLLVLD